MPADSLDLAALLRAADRKVLGAEFARKIGDVETASRIDNDAVALYVQALDVDPMLEDSAWRVVENRDRGWLDRNGLGRIPGPRPA